MAKEYRELMIDRQIIKCTRKNKHSERGPYTFKNLGMKNRGINNWTRRRPMPRLTTGPWGRSSTSRHIKNGSKTILSTKQDYETTNGKGIQGN